MPGLLVHVGSMAICPPGEPFRDSSYAFYSIRPEGAEQPGGKIDQKIAKLLLELDGKGNSGRALQLIF